MKKLLAMPILCLLFLTPACSSGGSEETANSTAEGLSRSTATQTESAQPAKGSSIYTMPSDGKPKTIKFSMYYYDEYYEEAVRVYEAKHPNITIDLTYMAKAGDDVDTQLQMLDKFRQTTSTETLTGKGPDLIDTGSLAIEAFIGRKLFVNLNDAMAQDPSFDKNQFFTNILDNPKQGSGLYTIPLHFYLSALVGDKGAVERSGISIDDKNWNWDQFTDIANQMTDKADHPYGYFFKSETTLLNGMLQNSYAQIVDVEKREAHFDSGLFINMLNKIKSMSDNSVMTLDSKHARDTYFMDVSVNSLGSYVSSLHQTGYSKPGYYLNPKSEGEKPGGFIYGSSGLAINANSTVKAETWDFLKYVMSGESDNGKYGFPINKAAYQRQAEKLLQQGTIKAMGESGEESYPVTAADLQGLDKMITNAVNVKSNVSDRISSIVFSESRAFFSGQKSAEMVAKLIQNKVSTYLNE
jgi:multiple sugar transport system substrate-binding protein